MNCALLIGINYLKTELELNGCIDDVINIRAMLIDKYNFSSIIVLRDDDDANLPTRDNIINTLQNLVNISNTINTLYIHYSGHGTNLFSGKEKDGFDECIVPIDFKTRGFIVDDTINSILRNVKCRTRCVFDSCHSGTIVDLRYTMRFTPKKTFYYEQENSQNINADIMSLSACLDPEVAEEAYNKQFNKSMGALTMMILRVLYNVGYKNITCPVLLEELHGNLKINKFYQHPELGSSKPFETSDVFFYNSAFPLPTPIIPKPNSKPRPKPRPKPTPKRKPQKNNKPNKYKQNYVLRL